MLNQLDERQNRRLRKSNSHAESVRIFNTTAFMMAVVPLGTLIALLGFGIFYGFKLGIKSQLNLQSTTHWIELWGAIAIVFSAVIAGWLGWSLSKKYQIILRKGSESELLLTRLKTITDTAPVAIIYLDTSLI